jgi:hypothetical protein
VSDDKKLTPLATRPVIWPAVEEGALALSRLPRNPGNSASCPRCSWRPQSGSFVAGPRFPARPTRDAPAWRRHPAAPVREQGRRPSSPSCTSISRAERSSPECGGSGLSRRLVSPDRRPAARSRDPRKRSQWPALSEAPVGITKQVSAHGAAGRRLFAHGGVAAALREERHSLALEAK